MIGQKFEIIMFFYVSYVFFYISLLCLPMLHLFKQKKIQLNSNIVKYYDNFK